MFNGKGDNAHEPFIFPGESGFNFCKTAYKPYDTVVVACLFVARDYFAPDQLEIASDGEAEENAFDEGANYTLIQSAAIPRICFAAATRPRTSKTRAL